MRVEIDQDSGFCFGVVYAIKLAEEELDETGELYCLGDIVHNDLEVKRLADRGLKIINHGDLETLSNTTVLIRAHGEPPSTYETAIKNNITLIDASCPVVLKLQHRVKSAFDKFDSTEDAYRDGQIVILGKPGHAEVNGLIGQTDQEAIIVMEEADLDKIDYTQPIYFFSQTTKSTEKFYRFKEIIIERAAATGNDFVQANDTICRQVSNRDPHLRKFAKQYDVIVFVAGKKSSNGKVLYGVCKEENPNTHFISFPEELDATWFRNVDSVGICGATSTPMWLMEKVAADIENAQHLQLT